MRKEDVDYSLYLVTDSTPGILGNQDLCQVVEAAIKGGVSCVQYRDKLNDTAVLVSTGRKLHEITSRYRVPLLINDRVDVALAIGCEGVHLGQDDLDLRIARALLGPDAIIGASASSVEEVETACEQEADYLGIGTVFATPTKENSKSIIGVDGLRLLLEHISRLKSPGRTVCIGGINASNASRVLWQGSAPERSLDGVAVVSAIVAAKDPEAASRELLRLIKSPPAFARSVVQPEQGRRSAQELLAVVAEMVKSVAEKKPLSHNMTNLVVQNIAANVALCIGASPIMANYGEEAEDLARLGGALVINMGSVTPEGLANHLKALQAYNDVGQPVVFDAVGAGATGVRRAATATILGGGYADVLKGNQSEMLACVPGGPREQQRGVDSGDSGASLAELCTQVRNLARARRNIVVLTGARDLVTAGQTVYAVDNGHAHLGAITGSGCCLGTAISAYAAAGPEDKLAATVAAMLHFETAAEAAAERDDVRGPGTFVPAFLDELHRIRLATAAGNVAWLARARVSVVSETA